MGVRLVGRAPPAAYRFVLMAGFHFDFKEAPKNVRLKRGDMRRIWGYLLPAWGPAALILFCIITSALLGLVPPLLIRALAFEDVSMSFSGAGSS